MADPPKQILAQHHKEAKNVILHWCKCITGSKTLLNMQLLHSYQTYQKIAWTEQCHCHKIFASFLVSDKIKFLCLTNKKLLKEEGKPGTLNKLSHTYSDFEYPDGKSNVTNTNSFPLSSIPGSQQMFFMLKAFLFSETKDPLRVIARFLKHWNLQLHTIPNKA